MEWRTACYFLARRGLGELNVVKGEDGRLSIDIDSTLIIFVPVTYTLELYILI